MAPTLESYLMRRLNIKYGAARSLALLGRVLLGMEKDEPATVSLQRECLKIYGILPADYDDPEPIIMHVDPSIHVSTLLHTRAEILVMIQRPVAEIVNKYEEIVIGPKEQQQEEQDLAKEQSQDCTAETFEETSSSEESLSGWTSKESAIYSSEEENLRSETDPAFGTEVEFLEKVDDVSLPDNHNIDQSSCSEESYSEALPNTELRGTDDARKKKEVVSLLDKNIYESSWSADSSEASALELRGINDLQLRRVNLQRRAMVFAYQERYGPIQKRIEQAGHEAPLKVKRNIEMELDLTEDLTESDAADEEDIREVPRKVTVVDSKFVVKELKEQRAQKEELKNKEKKLDEILARFQKPSSERIVDQIAATKELSFFASLLATIENGGDGTDASGSVKSTSTSTSTLIKNCSWLIVPPATAQAAMDCKEIVMAALYFLSSSPPPLNADDLDTCADSGTHTTGSANLLLLLPLIRPQEMTLDLENISYQKVRDDWKLIEIESQVAVLEEVFCTVALSMYGLAGSAFVRA
jgi:hypothetical protein